MQKKCEAIRQLYAKEKQYLHIKESILFRQ